MYLNFVSVRSHAFAGGFMMAIAHGMQRNRVCIPFLAN